MSNLFRRPLGAPLAGMKRLGLLRRWALPLRLAPFLAVMGPGMLTGIVDDDPSGITGYSLAGVHFGYDLLWAVVVATVALAIIAEIAARMGAVTGKGLGELIRERFGVRITAFALLVLFIANAATTVSEFAGIAGASEIFGVSPYITVPLAALLIFTVVVRGTYRRVEKVLLIGALVSFSYVITAFLAGPDWGDVARSSVVPQFHLTLPYLTLLIGLIGTTITPWQQFYLQSSVVDKGLGEREYPMERIDVYAGSAAAGIIAFFIIVTTAATLHANAQPADTVTDVGKALEPLAGDFAAKLFAIALLNAGLLGAAVLPLTTAYAICGAFGWERSINAPLREAPVFFGLFGGLLLIGTVVVLIPGAPLLVLMFLPNVVGGILLPVILVLMLKLVTDRHIMGDWVSTPKGTLIAWLVTGAIIVVSVVYAVIAVLDALGLVGG